MVSCNNSVWSRLQAALPDCVQFKCICHSLSLCIQYAVGKLPSNIGFLIHEIPHWFSHSELRRENYKQLFAQINSSSTESYGNNKTAPLPFLKPSTTRSLVRGKVMNNIGQNWDELIDYFTAAESLKATRTDSKYKARLLKEMLLDKTNSLYFSFATPIVAEFERINVLFQQTSSDPSRML